MPTDRPFIKSLRIQNFGCIQDATFQLSPLHALIGPNDTGKSTVLQLLHALALLGDRTVANPVKTAIPAIQRLTQETHQREVAVDLITSNDTVWKVTGGKGAFAESVFHSSAGRGDSHRFSVDGDNSQAMATGGLAQIAHHVQLMRLDPDSMRAPSALIPDGAVLRLENERGLGLAGLYDALQTRDENFMRAINARVRELFPATQQISLKNTGDGQKALGIKLQSGETVGADFMSEGLLYFLAFIALEFTEKPGLLLIEEPENGLHPSRIRDVMKVFRTVSERTQVVLATHSPLVVNELAPDEVTVVTRDPTTGTHAKLIKDTPNFAERSKIYALGELWLSYADGIAEEPLLVAERPS